VSRLLNSSSWSAKEQSERSRKLYRQEEKLAYSTSTVDWRGMMIAFGDTA